MKKMFYIVIVFMFSISLFSCSNNKKTKEYETDEKGTEFSFEDYKRKLYDILDNSTQYHVVDVKKEEILTGTDYSIGKNLVEVFYWYNGYYFDDTKNIRNIYSNDKVQSVICEDLKISNNMYYNKNEYTVYMPTVEQVVDVDLFFSALYLQDFAKAIYDVNTGIYTYINDRWYDKDGNLSDFNIYYKITENYISVTHSSEAVDIINVYKLNTVSDMAISEKYIIKDGFLFWYMNDSYYLISAPISDVLYLPEHINGNSYKVNIGVFSYRYSNVVVSKTVVKFVLGISEMNRVFVNKIMYAGTESEWNRVNSEGYVEVISELNFQ